MSRDVRIFLQCKTARTLHCSVRNSSTNTTSRNGLCAGQQTPQTERDHKSESRDAELMQQMREDSNKNTDYHLALIDTCTRLPKHGLQLDIYNYKKNNLYLFFF